MIDWENECHSLWHTSVTLPRFRGQYTSCLAEAPIQFMELIIYSKEELEVENFLCISLNWKLSDIKRVWNIRESRRRLHNCFPSLCSCKHLKRVFHKEMDAPFVLSPFDISLSCALGELIWTHCWRKDLKLKRILQKELSTYKCGFLLNTCYLKVDEVLNLGQYFGNSKIKDVE